MARAARQFDSPSMGIDLGTTYSVVASLDEAGRPVIIPNEYGDVLTPSALLFRKDGVAVGREAVDDSTTEPDGYADCFKRDIGARCYRHPIRGVEVPPEVLSGFLLRHLRSYAQRRIGDVDSAVLTVPAYFDEARRQSTIAAARLSGMEVLDIINEPTAAAVAYAYQTGILERDGGFPHAENLVVYDLGGGTFDATVLHVHGWIMRALATDGDVRLGGRDIDERIVDCVADRFLAEHGLDPRVDPSVCASLWLEAERAKHALSKRQRTTLSVSFSGLDLQVELTRPELENLVADLLARTETTLRQLMRDAGLAWHDVSRILLVGGATRMPMVPEMVRRVTGIEPEVTLSPDETVARGAALYAGMLQKNSASPTLSRLKLVNVNSHSVGFVGRDLKTGRLVNEILIARNTPLPTRVRRAVPLSKRDQRRVIIPIVEGEARAASECVQLGKCLIDDLPTGLEAGTKVFVEYALDASGLITVTAELPHAGRGAKVQISRSNKAEFQSLDTWSGLLAAQVRSAVVDAEGSENRRANLLKELDEQLIQLGQVALWNTVPEPLAADKRAVVETFRHLEVAQRDLAAAQSRQRDASSRTERISASSEVARCNSQIRELQQQYQFLLLGLGRLVMEQQVALPDSTELVRNIVRIQRLFAAK